MQAVVDMTGHSLKLAKFRVCYICPHSLVRQYLLNLVFSSASFASLYS